jgi:hypothetical protein
MSDVTFRSLSSPLMTEVNTVLHISTVEYGIETANDMNHNLANPRVQARL